MTFCIRLAPGAPLQKIGGKARSLLRLADAGLTVPKAIVVTTDLFATLRADGPKLPSTLNTPGALTTVEGAARALAAAPWPAGFASTLAREIDTLVPEPWARYAVRSSASIEDDAGALAAGLFLSRVDVARVEVLEAVRAVLGSAISPAVVAYLAQHGLESDNLGFAVLIHEFVEGEANGAAAFDPARAEPPTIEVHSGRVPAIEGAVRTRVEEAVRALAKTSGAVELEWVVSDGQPTFLQLRPLQSPARLPARPVVALPSFDPISAATDRDLNDTDWHWDAAHNPLPLSPAQAGLVSLVDEQCKIGLRQRVVGGYLFYATDPTSETTPIGAADALRGLWEAARQRLARPTPTLEQALETFVAIYQPLFGVVQPNSRAATGVLAAYLRRNGFDPAPLLPKLLSGVSSAATERARRARALAEAVDPKLRAAALDAYLEEFGDEAPRWDVAAPTWRERSASLERLMRGTNVGAPIDDRSWREASAAVRARLSEDAHTEWESRLSVARRAVAVAEDDDALYARLQAHVRRALLGEGERLWQSGVLADPNEVFWLPLESVRRDARREAPLGYEEAALALTAARSADAEARTNPPPLGAADTLEVGADMVRGRPGAAGARIGPVRIYRGDHEHDHDGEHVLVARTLLPTELPLLSPAAIVVETGGVLDHVAAQARERAIPAVVGAVGACRALRDGDQVLVDGSAGLVVRLA
ncbi:MAG TPA: PEP/pyruvate-binding domain-containing protein [Polyangia bacterium]|nr:PEP/pyruvate-binding domain-containing protein [Polyangia bacterium]